MTSTPPGEDARTPAPTSDAVWRVRLATACLLLTALCFRQGGGKVVPDTKLDLTLDPWAFLGRALHVWDDGFLGQLQNQAYGYLFPVGPFHAVLRAAQVPEWVTQRLWWSVVLCTAFLGLWRLARAVGVGGPWTRYLGALLFALAPRFQAEVAVTSVEVWPMAVAPWVLLPLLDPAPARLRHRILRSALAFGCIGGINAVATGAALVLPALWWATRARAHRPVRGFAAWLGACLLAGSWWLGPLLVLGRYSPPFLDWIESAATTTATASPFTALQGLTPWLAHLRVGGLPTWPAGWVMLSQPVLVAVTTLPAVVGLAGLALRRLPEAPFWRLSLVVGLLLVTAGHTGAVHGPLAAQVETLLDGPLAALRNTHKLEVVVRVPLLVGLVHATSTLAARWRPAGLVRGAAAATAGLLVLATAAPAVAGMMPRAGGYEQVATHWREVARWLDDRPGPGSVLVVPAAPFAELTWGSPRDEPLQALVRRPFAVRDAVPLGSAGTTRYLDELERALRAGSADPGLRESLVASGIRYLVVRNDLRRSAGGAPPLAVHEALAEAGIERAAAFGPPTGSPVESEGATLGERTLLPYPAVEVFDAGPVDDARLVRVADVPTLTGGPEDVPALQDVLPGGVAVLPGDAAALPSGGSRFEVLTDGNQRREVDFGRASGNRSPVLAVDDPWTTRRRVHDYVVDPAQGRTVLRWEGVAGVAASSSAADAGSLVRTSSGDGPAAALDADPTTRWVSGRYATAIGEWLEVTLPAPRPLRGATLTLDRPGPGAALPSRLDVTTDAGTTTLTVPTEPGRVVRRALDLPVPTGPTRRLRVTVRSVGPGAERGVAVVRLSLPGVAPVPRLVLPSTPSGTPDVVALRRQVPGRSGCLRQGGRPLCAASQAEPREEADGLFRAFATSAPTGYAWEGTVRPRAGAAVLLDQPGRTHALATSSRVADLAGRPGAAVDADPGTGWVAAADDPRPTLRLTLPAVRPVTGLVLAVDPHLAASRPRTVEIRADDGRWVRLPVGIDGTARVPAGVRARVLDIAFTQVSAVRSTDPRTGMGEELPVGVSEVRILGADDFRRPLDLAARVDTPCGGGPQLVVDGVRRSSRVIGTTGDVLAGRPLAWRPCGVGSSTVPVRAGEHEVSARAGSRFLPDRLVLRRAESATAPTAAAVTRRPDGTYAVPPLDAASLLVLPHNANHGWSATDSTGRELTPVRVDGRRQGWLLPSGPATVVRPRFAPQTPYAALLAGGGLAFVGIGALALRGRRRPGGGGPPASAALPGPLVPGAVVGLLWLFAGWWGLGAGVLAAGGGLLLAAGTRGGGDRARRACDIALPSLVVAAGAAATTLAAARPWGSGGAGLTSAVVQLLVVLAVALACLGPLQLRRPA